MSTSTILDPARVAANSEQVVRQLARLSSAIIKQMDAGADFAPSIKIELGNAVALLVACVKPGDEDGNSREDRATDSDTAARGDAAAPAV